MGFVMDKLEQMWMFMSFESIVLLLSLLIIFIAIHFYSLSRGKKELLELVDKKVNIFKKAFDISEDAILILSHNNDIEYANASMKKLLGLKDNFLLQPLPQMPKIQVKDKWVDLDTLSNRKDVRAGGRMLSYLQVNLSLNRSKNPIPINLYLESNLLGSKHDKWCNIISIHDLRQKKEQKVIGAKHQLTGIANEIKLTHDLNALYSKIHLKEQKIALMVIDIDNFSMLRSIIGHDQMNAVLCKFASYLENASSKLDITAYHTYYNNFLVTVANLDNTEELLELSDTIQKKLASFYKMDDVKLHLTASIGIGLYPESGTSRHLLDKTYKALVQAQAEGDGRTHIYAATSVTHDYDELVLHNEMHEALEKNQFEVYYQPIVDAKTKEVVSAEALIRWNHPQYGVIGPYVFIPIMEKTGFIVEVGQYVIEEVLKQQKRWQLFNFKQINVSINITLQDIVSKNFISNVENLIYHHQVKPELIKFEITEGAAMISEESTRKEFKNVKNMGVGISLDDFGTGYTSFSYLKKFPADILKIDKTMIDYILTNKEDQKIVKAMIELGHNLGMKVVAEGIENKRMAEMLTGYGCDLLQGYYFAKPLPVFEFQKLLR